MSAFVAKSGWLYRQSTVLKKWKRNWFVLTQDGYLRYFETEFSNRADDALLVPVQVTAVRTGPQNHGRTPEGLSDRFLISVESTSGSKWVMCAESEDDMRAWEISLNEARMISQIIRPSSAPPGGVRLFQHGTPYAVADDLSPRYVYRSPIQNVTYAYPGQVFYGSSTPGQILVPGNTVIYRRQPALGSRMFAPLLWW